MKFIIKIAILVVVFILNIPPQICKGQNASKAKSSIAVFPKPIHYTSDFENVLEKQEEDKLNILISKIREKTQLEIAVVSITSQMMGNLHIDSYSLELAQRWGVGKKEHNNGILIAFSKQNGNIRIQTGTGIEMIYSNNEIKKVIDQTIIPAFKMDRFYEGLFAGIIRISEELKPLLKNK